MSQPAPILDPDVALALWRWGWEVLRGPRPTDGRPRVVVVEGVVDVLSLAACELALAGRSEWLAELPELLSIVRGFFLQPQPPRTKCLQSLTELLGKGAPVTKGVQAMARSAHTAVRAAVAGGLRADDPQARPLLEALALDPDLHVRTLAQARLPERGPTAWWAGKWQSDPLPRLSRVDDTILAALRTVARFADRPSSERAELVPELQAALPAVPTPLLFEVVQRLVTFDWIVDDHRHLLAEVLRRPAGDRALWGMISGRLGRPHEWTHFYLILGHLLHGLPPDAAERLCRGLLECLIEHRATKQAEDMAHIVESVLRERWPASLPGTILLDAWQALADAPAVAEHIRPLLAHERVDLRAAFGRVVELAEHDEELVDALSSTAARLDPDAQRVFIVRALRSESNEVRTVGLQRLTTLPPDPSAGSIEALFARWWAEPVLRRAMFSDHDLTDALCPHLRRCLRAGELSLHEAAATLRATGRLWGGTHHEDDDEDDERAARHERTAAWHEGATELGPPTDDEWAMWRSLRRDALAQTPKMQAPQLLQVRPAGPLHADDRDIIEQLMARWRRAWATAPDVADERGDHVHESYGILFTIGHLVDPAIVPLLEEVAAAVQPFDTLADMADEQLRELRQALATTDPG